MADLGKLGGQSAMEFLFTYSWALLIIGVVVVAFFVFIGIPKSSIPTQCTFSFGVVCQGIVVGSNALGTQINLVATNGQDYDILNPYVTIGLGSYGTSKASCVPQNVVLPYAVVPGGAILCTASIPTSITLSTYLSGSIMMNASTCVSGNAQSCSEFQNLVYTGNFTTYVTGYTGQIPVSIALAVPSGPIQAGISTPVTARVKMFGQPAGGLQVVFATNSPSGNISPEVVVTDSSGNATSYFTSGTGGYFQITANTVGLSSTGTVQVIR